jgi:site-specific recombinase XerD
LKQEPRPLAAYRSKVDAWASFLSTQEALSQTTVANYCWWASGFLEWLQEHGVPLRQVTLAKVDGFMDPLSAKGLSRVTLATAAKALRRFLRYAYEQGWCRRDLVQGVLSPRLYRQENLPTGPAWSDVKRLIAATDGSTVGQLRNRAMLLLLAVYGLRSGEVRGLSLEDLDWARRVLRVRRSKTARVQEYPLTTATGQAIGRYLEAARPDCARRELFLTLHAPFRQLSPGALYRVTCSGLERLEISSPKRGPHALRHACASYLLNGGLSLKEVGDHLGHRDLSATQIYAKVDLAGLRAIATFDLGGLL